MKENAIKDDECFKKKNQKKQKPPKTKEDSQRGSKIGLIIQEVQKDKYNQHSKP